MENLSEDEQFHLLSLYLEVLRDPLQRVKGTRRDAFKNELIKNYPELRESLEKFEEVVVAKSEVNRRKSWGIEIDWISFQFAPETKDGYFSRNHLFGDGSFVGRLSSSTELMIGAVNSIEERLKLAEAKAAGYTHTAQLRRMADLRYAKEVLELVKNDLDEFENTQYLGELQRSLRAAINCWKKCRHLWADVNALNAYLMEEFSV